MTVRMSEKEAIERGIIQPPAKPVPDLEPWVPPAKQVQVQPATSPEFKGVVLTIVGWLVGFLMGLACR